MDGNESVHPQKPHWEEGTTSRSSGYCISALQNVHLARANFGHFLSVVSVPPCAYSLPFSRLRAFLGLSFSPIYNSFLSFLGVVKKNNANFCFCHAVGRRKIYDGLIIYNIFLIAKILLIGF